MPAAIAAHPEIADVVCVDAHGLQRFAQVLGGKGVEEEIAFNQQALNRGCWIRAVVATVAEQPLAFGAWIAAITDPGQFTEAAQASQGFLPQRCAEKGTPGRLPGAQHLLREIDQHRQPFRVLGPCQQLLPGTSQDPTKLEMGRKYEEVDAGAVAPREPGAPATDREKAVAAGALGN